MDLRRFLKDEGGQSIGRFSVSGTMMEYETYGKKPTNTELQGRAISYAHILNSVLDGRGSLGILRDRNARRIILFEDPKQIIGIVYVGGEEGILVEFSGAIPTLFVYKLLEEISMVAATENLEKE